MEGSVPEWVTEAMTYLDLRKFKKSPKVEEIYKVVSQYKILFHGSPEITISVCQSLDGRFGALTDYGILGPNDREPHYPVGSGDSEMEALAGCLIRIRDRAPGPDDPDAKRKWVRK